MSSDDWENTTFYNQDATNLSSGLLNANNISSSLKLSDYRDTSVAEKGWVFARPNGSNKTVLPATNTSGCRTEWKWDWKCGSSTTPYSSNPRPLKPIGSNVKWFDDSTSTQMVVDDELFTELQRNTDSESRGLPSPRSIRLDCINQSRSCDVRLHLDDFGILTIRRLKPDKDEDEILWRSHTSTTSQLPEDAIPHELYIPSNTSEQNIGRPRDFTGRELMGLTTRDSGLLDSKVHSLSTPETLDTPGYQTARVNSRKAARDRGRSFLFANDKITKGAWLSSPNGMCRLTLNDVNELIVEYYTSKCSDLQSTEVLDVHDMNSRNNPTKIGKMGYIDGLGILHEFPVAPLDATGNASGFGSTYWGTRTHEEEESVNKYTYFDGFTLGTTNSRPNQTTTATNISECEKWCTADKLCAAYSFDPKATPASKCNIVSLPSGDTTLETLYTEGGKYAVRSKKIIGGDNSVPIEVSPINTVSNTVWNKYGMLGNKGENMTSTTIGGLAAATSLESALYTQLASEQSGSVAQGVDVRESFESTSTPPVPFVNSQLTDAIEYNRIHGSDIITSDSNSLKSGYNREYEKYNSSITDLNRAQTDIHSTLATYGGVQRELNNMDPEVTKQLTAMEEEKRLNLNSIKTRYLLWRILIIGVICIASFILFRRLRSSMNAP